MDELNNQNNQNTQNTFDTLPVFRPTDDGWGSLPQSADVFGVVGLSQEQVAVKSFVDEQIRQKEQELNINSARRDVYAMTMGKEKAGTKETELQKQIDEKKKIYGDRWSDLMTEGYRSNFWKDQYNSLQQYYGYGRHVDINLETLRNLALNKNLNKPDTLSYLGIAQEVKDNNNLNSFSRSWALSSLQNEVKQDYFDNTGYNTQEDFENTQQALSTAQYLYTNDDDSTILSFAGQSGDMLLGGIDRVWGGWGNGLATLAGSALLVPFTGGSSLKLWGAYTFAKDMFDTTRADIAFNAKLLDPTLTDHDAFYSPANLFTSLGLSILNTVGVGYMGKISVGAINKILNTGKMLDKTLVTGVDSASVKLARNKAVLTELQNGAKELGVSTGVNAGVGGATAFTQQLVTNVVGNQKDILEGTGSALTEGVGTGALMGALPLPIEMARLGYVYRSQTKAMNSVLDALNKKSKDAVLHNTDAYKQNPTGTAETLQQENGFHEDRVYINIRDMDDWGKKNNVDLRQTEWGKKIQEAEAQGKDEVALDLKEQAQLKDGRWQKMVDELGRQEIDDIPPTEIKDYLSEEEQQRAKDIAKAVKDNKDKLDQELEDGGKKIADDLYKQMDGLPLEPRQKDSLIGMNIDFFKSIATTYGIPIDELWGSLKGHWQPFDRTLYSDAETRHDRKKMRGNYTPQKGTIELAHDADMATATHEFAHYALDTLMKLSINSNNLGKPIHKLNSALSDLLGKDWKEIYINKDKEKDEVKKAEYSAKLGEMQERFAFQFLDYILGIEGKSEGTEVLRDVKKMIVTAERRRLAQVMGNKYKGVDAQRILQAEFLARFKYELPKRSDAFDSLANALFKAHEVMRQMEDDYSTDSIAALMPDAVLEEKRRLHPEEMTDIDKVNREIRDAKDDAEKILGAQMIRQSGYLFSFNDGFMKRWKQLTKDKDALKKIIDTSHEAKEIFRKAREKAKEQIDNTVMGRLYDLIQQYKVNDGQTITELKKSGLLTQAQYKALKEKGIIVEKGGRNPEDFYGRVDGVASREIVRDKRFAQELELMLQFPDKDQLIYTMALDSVSKSLKARQDLATSTTRMREFFTKTRTKIADANAKILHAFTKTPMDKEGVIKYVASELVRKTRLADLHEGDTMRRAKNARRELERSVVKGDFERAGKESRAERVHIRMANFIVKEKIYLRDQLAKQMKLLSSDKKAERNGYDNEILDLARFIADKNNLIADRKKLTLETLNKYKEHNPVIGDLLEKYKDYLEPSEQWLNRTVDETHALFDVLRDIEVQARNYRSLLLDDRRIDARAKEAEVHDAILYKKYAVDFGGHKQGDFLTDANGNKIEVEHAKNQLVDNDGNATATPTGFKNKFKYYVGLSRGSWARALNWCGKMDGKMGGICSAMLYHPITRASNRAKHAQNKVIDRIKEITSQVDWKAGEVIANELIDKTTGKPFKFGSCEGVYGNAGYHIFGFLMHMGNEENWRKLLTAQGWTEDQVFKFVDRMIKEGYITEKSLNALQDVWDLFNTEFDKANKVYYQMHGRYVAKVEPRAIEIKLSEGKTVNLKGGYAPLLSDRFRNPVHLEKPLDFESLKPDDVEKNLFYKGDNANSTPNFMQERSNKVYFVEFNPQRLLSVAPRVSAYTELMPAITQTYNFWRRPAIQTALNKVDPRAWHDVIQPFITKSLRRSMELNGDIFGSRFLNKLCDRVGTNMMCFNLTNAITQFGGILNAMLVVHPKYLMESFGAEFGGFNKLRNEVTSYSVTMRDRINESSSHLIEIVNQITVDTEMSGAWNKTRAFKDRSSVYQNKIAYCFQKAIQDRIDVAIWQGSFKQELKKLGKSAEDLTPEERDRLVRIADESVLKTQSSSNMLDKSEIENRNPVYKAFFQFHNYFITINALTFERWGQLSRSDATALMKAKAMFPILMLNYILPQYFAESVMMTGRGDWWNDDLDDVENFKHLFIASPIQQVTNAVPVFGDMANMIINHFAEENASNRGVVNLPSISYCERIITDFDRAMFKGQLDYRTSDALCSLLAVALNMPAIDPVGKALSHGAGIYAGQINPENNYDLARTLATGKVRSDDKNLD